MNFQWNPKNHDQCPSSILCALGEHDAHLKVIDDDVGEHVRKER
jgi:hypothetical protein